MALIRAAVLAFFFGAIAGALGTLHLTKPDPANQARHDQAVAAQRQLTAKRDTLVVRDTLIRRRVDSVLIATEPQVITIREALPDTLRPVLDSVIATHREAIDSVGALARDWRNLYDSTAAQLDTVMRFNAELVQQRKPSPIAVVVGLAATPRGIQPAVTVGFRVPLPRLRF